MIIRFNIKRTARILCIKEPLLKETLSLNNFGSDDRGDVYCDWIGNSEAVPDFVSCNVANDTLVQRRKLNPVSAFEFTAKEKHRKYDKDIEEANVDRNRPLVFIVFPFSINGRFSNKGSTKLFNRNMLACLNMFAFAEARMSGNERPQYLCSRYFL
ncbi:hypothetical protein P9112_002758 [Eukaryota sp. TZLM1-RC]